MVLIILCESPKRIKFELHISNDSNYTSVYPLLIVYTKYVCQSINVGNLILNFEIISSVKPTFVYIPFG